MKMSMDGYAERGKSEVQEKLQEGTRDIIKIGEEYKEVKDRLQDIPGGLDEDLLEMIREAETEGKAEAEQDIEQINQTVIEEAKASADTIDEGVQEKITDNSSARGMLEGIQSKYGKSSIEKAKREIDSNTERGEDLLKVLEDAIKDADQSIQNVKDNL